MKKGSTAATKQSKNISQQKLTIGLDLGDRHSWYCVVDETGHIQVEQRVRTNEKALREVFGCAATQARTRSGGKLAGIDSGDQSGGGRRGSNWSA